MVIVMMLGWFWVGLWVLGGEVWMVGVVVGRSRQGYVTLHPDQITPTDRPTDALTQPIRPTDRLPACLSACLPACLTKLTSWAA